MRSGSIIAPLLADYAGAAQPRLSDDQLRAPWLRGNLLRIENGRHRLEPMVTVGLAADPNRARVAAAETLTSLMFAAIRVKLDWHELPVCPAQQATRFFLRLRHSLAILISLER